MNKFSFYYESNAYFGNIETFEDLEKAIRYQLEEPNSFNSIDDVLNNSRQSVYMDEILSSTEFGTRIEHTGDYTLKQYLKDKKVLGRFLKYYNRRNF